MSPVVPRGQAPGSVSPQCLPWPGLLPHISFVSCRGGKICLTDHFKPLWARNVPKFGLAHLMALGVRFHQWGEWGESVPELHSRPPVLFALQLGPWLAVEIPDLIAKGLIEHKEK